MYCKHCGKEISDDARFCSGCGNPLFESYAPAEIDDSKKKKRKKKHPVLGAILLFIGIFIIIGAFSDSNEPQKVESSEVPATVAETTVSSAYTVGDTLEMNNIIVTLNDVSENNGSQFLKPADGNVFVVCELTIENKTNSDLAVSSLMSFECYFDDFSTNISLGAMTADSNKRQLDGSVAAGKKINGVIGYEVPVNWKEMEIHFNSDLFSTKPFIFNYSK